MQASVLVTGQIHHDGDSPMSPILLGPPNMLIHPERRTPTGSPTGVGIGLDRSVSSTAKAAQNASREAPPAT